MTLEDVSFKILIINQLVIRDTSIDDLTLLEICSSPDHPYRGQIEFDKKRHPSVIVDASIPKIKPKRTKLRGKNRENMDSFDRDFDNLEADEIDEPANQSRKLKSFFGENVDKATKRIKIKTKLASKKLSIDDESEKEVETAQQAEKLKEFFGENVSTSTKYIASPSAMDPVLLSSTTSSPPQTQPPPPLRRRRNQTIHTPRLDSNIDDIIESSDNELKSNSVGMLIDHDDLEEGSKKASQNILKLQDFFGENVATAASPKLADFFGESKKIGHKKKLKKKDNNSIKPDIRDSIIPAVKNGSKKLEAFFGDRPPPELIAKNMDAFFPGLQGLHQIFSSKDKAVGKFQEIAFESAKNKRMSKLQSQHQQVRDINEKREIADLPIYSIQREKSVDMLSKKSKSLEFLDVLRASTATLSKYENDDILLVPQNQSLNSITIDDNNSKDIISKVEEMLNLPRNGHHERSPSNADFLETFAIKPDEPKSFNWIQGPLIGMGSFGKVFYGANCENGDIMAVKQVPIKNSAFDSKTKKKMLIALYTEIELLKNLDHANIVRYLGYYTEKNVINVFLEYVSGGSVTSALALMGPFDELLVKSLIMQTLHGLNYLHKMHIIHRDIKGGNSKHWQKFNLIQF